VIRGMASVNQYFLQLYTSNWLKNDTVPSAEEWKQAQGFYRKARDWSADTPSLLQAGGRLFLWEAELEKDGKKQNKAIHRALALFTQALSQEPAYVYNWLSYAQAKARLQQRDDQYVAALQQVRRLGKYETQAQLGLLQLRLKNLPNLSSSEHAQLVIELNELAKQDSSSLIEVIDRYNLKLFLCYRVRGVKRIDAYCRR